MELLVKDKKTALAVSDAVFACEYNEGLVHQIVMAQMNSMRSGNSAQKTRAEVRGGGRKPWKQKGTGRARAGTIRSPLWRSGGVIFAAKKRSYAQKVNKKMYKKAVCVIFSELYRLGRMVIVSSFACDSHKTKAFKAKMQDLGLNNALVVTKDLQEYDYLGSRNLAEYAVCDVYSLDPVSLLKFEHIVMTEEAVKALEEQLA